MNPTDISVVHFGAASMIGTPLTVVISIIEEFIQDKQWTIIRNSEEEEEKFVTELTNTIRNIDTTDISNKELLKEIIQEYARISDSIWYKFSKMSTSLNVPKHGEMRSATPIWTDTDPPRQ